MANRLAQETSPYLLQHSDNPVHWYPWCEEAITRARQEDKPILLSIGYSACHWCHIMAHESFEDRATATYINQHFVPIKVDREERPDIDAIYMEAVQAMTGQGGWPLTVFLDSELAPFYGGTYFPLETGGGMPSFRQVMEAVVASWQNNRARLREAASALTQRLAAAAKIEPSGGALDPNLLDDARQTLLANFDDRYGGFDSAPKFPSPLTLELLLRRYSSQRDHSSREAVEETLTAIAHGGIYDQVGGGFARYAVDRQWLVPHFEKMLYDNALLARSYLHAWQVSGKPLFKKTCEETLDWALREMRTPEQSFYSALDADSEGQEGKFYLWSKRQLEDLLGGDAASLIEYWGVTESGNFEGCNILHVAAAGAVSPEQLERAREILYQARSKRIWPGLDDKQLTAWNALMISALADAGAVLRRDDYIQAASSCADFLLTKMAKGPGSLLRSYKNGEAKLNGYLEDHAFTVEALLDLYQTTFDERWFIAAHEILDRTVERFADSQSGGFFTTSVDHEQLLIRRKDLQDHPIPSGNSSLSMALLKFAALTGEERYRELALGPILLTNRALAQHPQAFPYLLCAVDLYLTGADEIALVGDRLEPMLTVVRDTYRPNMVIAAKSTTGSKTAVPLLRDRSTVDGTATAYLCKNFSCKRPTIDPKVLQSELN